MPNKIDVTELIKKDLEARREKGIKKYGKPLSVGAEAVLKVKDDAPDYPH